MFSMMGSSIFLIGSRSSETNIRTFCSSSGVTSGASFLPWGSPSILSVSICTVFSFSFSISYRLHPLYRHDKFSSHAIGMILKMCNDLLRFADEDFFVNFRQFTRNKDPTLGMEVVLQRLKRF